MSKLSDDLNVDHVRLNQAADFFFLPQLNVIYEKFGDELKKLLCSKLKSGSDGQAVQQAADSDDCPVCDVLRDGETVGQVL